ncbi:hypothetical protein [Nostoc linckia]|jgi:hypothetical protein|uniref:hypothetical protein n=1 Tax=Nostoc linckia TaxID=92942 RepID=UPI00117D6E81|nr:hypothetical protein [Nostoc linckia]
MNHQRANTIIALNQEVFAELLTFVDFAEKFTIGFVEINFSLDVEILIEALKTNPKCQNIQFINMKFSDENLRFLRDEIVKVLPTSFGYRYRIWRSLFPS